MITIGVTNIRSCVKEAAEYYAFGYLSDIELLDMCRSIEEADVAFRYAKAYGEEYDKWISKQQEIIIAETL
jgi:hypothetical protein